MKFLKKELFFCSSLYQTMKSRFQWWIPIEIEQLLQESSNQCGSYSRVTWLCWLQVTWNQVQGLTRVGSQLWRTLSGSDKLRRSAWRASPSEFDSVRRIRAKVRIREAAKSSCRLFCATIVVAGERIGFRNLTFSNHFTSSGLQN